LLHVRRAIEMEIPRHASVIENALFTTRIEASSANASSFEMPDTEECGLVEDDDDTVIEPHDYTGDYDLESEPEDDDDDDE